MKPITIDMGMLLHNVTLKPTFIHDYGCKGIEVYHHDSFLSTIYLDSHKLKYVCTVLEKKYYELVEV